MTGASFEDNIGKKNKDNIGFLYADNAEQINGLVQITSEQETMSFLQHKKIDA